MGAAQGIQAGQTYVKAYVDLSGVDRSLKQMQAKFESFGSRLSNIGAGVAGIGAGIAGVGTAALGGITALASRFADLGGALDDASQRTGISASALSELGYAAEMGGTDIATVEKSISKLQKGIASDSKAAKASFGEIGLSISALASLNPEQQFLTVGKAIAKIQDPTQRAAKAMEIFGKSGTQLLPLLTSDIEALRQEARDLGLTVSDIDAVNAAELGDAFDRVKKSLGGIATQLGAAVAVPFANIANIAASIIAHISDWVARNRNIVQTVAAVAAGFVVVGSIIGAIGVSIIGVGLSISLIGTAIGSIIGVATAVFSAVATVIGAVLSPIGLVVAAVVGLGAYIAYSALTATGGLTKLSKMFGSLGSVITETWGGIVAALSSGDVEAAGQIAFTALEVGWLTITTTMRQVWTNVSDFFVNVWLGAVESIVQIGASIYFGVAKYFDQLSNALVAGFDIAITYITGAIDSIQNAISKAIIKVQEFFGFFSKDQSVQIQASLDEDLKRRADNRQKGLDTRATDRGTTLDQRDKQRQATSQQFSTIVSEDFQRRKTTVENTELTTAQKRLEELKLSLSTKAAAAQKALVDQQNTEPVKQAQEAMASIQTESGGSTGTFAAGIAASIAGGQVSPLEDINRQQLDVLGSIDERLRSIDDAGGLD